MADTEISKELKYWANHPLGLHAQIFKKDSIEVDEIFDNVELNESWIRASARVYEMTSGQSHEGILTEKEVAEWGLEYVRSFNNQVYHVTNHLDNIGIGDKVDYGAAAVGLDIKAAIEKDPVKGKLQSQAFAYLIDVLDHSEMSVDGAKNFAQHMLTDYGTWGAVFTGGVALGGKEAAKAGIKYMAKNSLKSWAGAGADHVAYRGAIGAYKWGALGPGLDGAANVGVTDWAFQTTNIGAGRQEEHNWLRTGLMATGGAAFGYLGSHATMWLPAFNHWTWDRIISKTPERLVSRAQKHSSTGLSTAYDLANRKSGHAKVDGKTIAYDTPTLKWKDEGTGDILDVSATSVLTDLTGSVSNIHKYQKHAKVSEEQVADLLADRGLWTKSHDEIQQIVHASIASLRTTEAGMRKTTQTSLSSLKITAEKLEFVGKDLNQRIEAARNYGSVGQRKAAGLDPGNPVARSPNEDLNDDIVAFSSAVNNTENAVSSGVTSTLQKNQASLDGFLKALKTSSSVADIKSELTALSRSLKDASGDFPEPSEFAPILREAKNLRFRSKDAGAEAMTNVRVADRAIGSIETMNYQQPLGAYDFDYNKVSMARGNDNNLYYALERMLSVRSIANSSNAKEGLEEKFSDKILKIIETEAGSFSPDLIRARILESVMFAANGYSSMVGKDTDKILGRNVDLPDFVGALEKKIANHTKESVKEVASPSFIANLRDIRTAPDRFYNRDIRRANASRFESEEFYRHPEEVKGNLSGKGPVGKFLVRAGNQWQKRKNRMDTPFIHYNYNGAFGIPGYALSPITTLWNAGKKQGEKDEIINQIGRVLGYGGAYGVGGAGLYYFGDDLVDPVIGIDYTEQEWNKSATFTDEDQSGANSTTQPGDNTQGGLNGGERGAGANVDTEDQAEGSNEPAWIVKGGREVYNRVVQGAESIGVDSSLIGKAKSAWSTATGFVSGAWNRLPDQWKIAGTFLGILFGGKMLWDGGGGIKNFFAGLGKWGVLFGAAFVAIGALQGNGKHAESKVVLRTPQRDEEARGAPLEPKKDKNTIIQEVPLPPGIKYASSQPIKPLAVSIKMTSHESGEVKTLTLADPALEEAISVAQDKLKDVDPKEATLTLATGPGNFIEVGKKGQSVSPGDVVSVDNIPSSGADSWEIGPASVRRRTPEDAVKAAHLVQAQNQHHALEHLTMN